MFKLSAVTPEKIVFEQEVSSIVAPGIEGYLGVMTNHAPLITPLTSGRLEVKDSSGQESEYFLAGGFLEVSANVATILADAIETPANIDVDRAKSAEQRARERLADRASADIDTARAETALKRALWRQKMAKI
ncbi:MAG: F0F1 ATP synthase subunit epsilon [candidate division Zixibacteria bacterium]|nr:F0F1 ATP synthase subunit epsilon [candidate division Zixibacteria bacterium]